jgi:hypothetical protein
MGVVLIARTPGDPLIIVGGAVMASGVVATAPRDVATASGVIAPALGVVVTASGVVRTVDGGHVGRRGDVATSIVDIEITIIHIV